jgi:hypothetical protein
VVGWRICFGQGVVLAPGRSPAPRRFWADPRRSRADPGRSGCPRRGQPREPPRSLAPPATPTPHITRSVRDLTIGVAGTTPIVRSRNRAGRGGGQGERWGCWVVRGWLSWGRGRGGAGRGGAGRGGAGRGGAGRGGAGRGRAGRGGAGRGGAGRGRGGWDVEGGTCGVGRCWG